MQWFVNNSQCQSSCRKISLKLFQRDKSLMDSFKGPASKFCIYFSFKSCHPFVLLPLWERRREGGAADKNFCLPSDQPTILFFGNGNCSKSVCKEILAYINIIYWKSCLQVTKARLKIGATAILVQTLFPMIFKWVIMSWSPWHPAWPPRCPLFLYDHIIWINSRTCLSHLVLYYMHREILIWGTPSLFDVNL